MAKRKARKLTKATRRGAGGRFAPTIIRDAAKAAISEAAQYSGLGKSQIAVGVRRRRILHLALRNMTVAAISAETGYTPKYISDSLQKIQRAKQEELSSWDLQVDAAQMRTELDEYRAMILEAMDTLGVDHPNWPKLGRLLLQLKLVEQRFMEKAGLRRELDEAAPPDISDLRSLPTDKIEEELAIVTNHLGRRITGRGWRASVQRMIEAEVVKVEDLPDPKAKEPAK